MRTLERSVSLKDVPRGRLGMWILIAGELLIFGGLIACYLLYRIRHPDWSAQAQKTNQFFGILNTIILLISSYTVVKAHESSKLMDYKKVKGWITATILLGLWFLVNKIFEYADKISHGYTLTGKALIETGNPSASLFWTFYYTATGLHALHVAAGLTALAIVLYQVKKFGYWHRIELAGIYWHMVDIIWIFLFPLFYFAR